MKYAIFADIHANLEALTAVLDFFKKEKVQRYICLGDIIGYGPDPGKCLKIIRKLVDCTVIAGNHDHGVAEKADINRFNQYAHEAILWTRKKLSQEDIDYLGKLPLVETIDNFTAVHSSLDKPEKWYYIKTAADTYFSFFYLTKHICFLGHSHIPKIFTLRDGQYDEFIADEFSVADKETRYIINVGSVGQPRDGIWKAACCIYYQKTQKVKIIRMPYNVEKTQEKILKAGLPEYLAIRLKPEVQEK